MTFFNKLIINISSLKFAIFLLLFICISSGLGTFIPQGKDLQEYIDIYSSNQFLGILDGEQILKLQLNQIYTSLWFLTALFLLCISLALSSFRKQIPTLKSTLKWLDYNEKEKFKKLKLSCNWETKENNKLINKADQLLKKEGWKLLINENRISARKGVAGRFGPILVHFGLIILLIGSTYGNFSRKSFEQYLLPNEIIDLINDNTNNIISLKLNNFHIDREDDGLPKQFTSNLEIFSNNSSESFTKETSVNHPIRYKGLTIYQADWAISNIVLKINDISYQLDLKPVPEIGEQIWGIVIELGEKIKKNYLLTINNEYGPIKIFDTNDFSETDIYLDEKDTKVNASKIEFIKAITSSGLLIKNDPSIPIIYLSFILILSGATLSLMPTKRLWILIDKDSKSIYMGGLCNKNLAGFEREFINLSSLLKT